MNQFFKNNIDRKISVFVVDDDEPSRKILISELRAYPVEIVGESPDCIIAMDDIINTEPDLIFLDIELPTMSGLEFCSLIHRYISDCTKVVFYTSHEKYILQALRLKAFDYLLKPFTAENLTEIISRYYQDKLTSLPMLVRNYEKPSLPIMVVNIKNEHIALCQDKIVLFRYNTDTKVWEVVCSDKSCCMLRHKTTSDIILNINKEYVQIHKRYIVNIKYVKMVQDNKCILISPLQYIDELQISKNYRKSFMDNFFSM